LACCVSCIRKQTVFGIPEGYKKYEVFFRIAEESKKPVKASKRLKFHWALARAFQAQFMPLTIGQRDFIV